MPAWIGNDLVMNILCYFISIELDLLLIFENEGTSISLIHFIVHSLTTARDSRTLANHSVGGNFTNLREFILQLYGFRDECTVLNQRAFVSYQESVSSSELSS